MALSFVNNALGSTSATTSFSLTLPATQEGDIILVEYCHRGTAEATLGGTYNGSAFGAAHAAITFNTSFSVKSHWSRCTGNHSGQTITGSGLTDSVAAIATIYRGCTRTATPVGGQVAEENASGNEAQAQVVTPVDGAAVCLVVGNSPDLAVTSPSSTSPGALNIRAEVLSTGGTDASIMHAQDLKGQAGGTGNLTWAQTNAVSGSFGYYLIPAKSIPIGRHEIPHALRFH